MESVEKAMNCVPVVVVVLLLVVARYGGRLNNWHLGPNDGV